MKEEDNCPVCKEGKISRQNDLEFEDIDLSTGKKTIRKFPNGTFACDFCSWVNEDENNI